MPMLWRTASEETWRDDHRDAGCHSAAVEGRPARARGGEYPQLHLAKWSGQLQADAYGGYTKLYDADRAPGPILEAACRAHARRPFFALADIGSMLDPGGGLR